MDPRRQSTIAWLLLTFTLPTKRASQRVEVWRKLQRYGTVPLGNSGYLLPTNPANEERFQWLATSIRKYGGDASIVRVRSIDNISTPQLIARFAEARAREYQELIRELQKFSSLPVQKRVVGRLSRLRGRFQEIVEVDFFDSPLQKRVGDLLAQADEARVTTRAPETAPIKRQARNRADQAAGLQEQSVGDETEARCGSLRVRMVNSALHRSQGTVCLRTGRTGTARSRAF